MVTQVNRSIMHPVHIVQGVSNAHCAIRSMVQRFTCINDGVATDRCIGCGMCTLVCPIGNFHLVDGKAERYSNVCEYCLACAHHCSVKAITIASEKNTNARFINENIKVSEIIQANRQH